MAQFEPHKLERFNLGVDWSGGWNHMPTPFEQIDAGEAFRYLFSSGYIAFPTVKHDHYRQVKDLVPNTVARVVFYYCYTTYIAVAYIFCYRDEDAPRGWLKMGSEGSMSYYYGFYRVGCKHERMNVRWDKMFDRRDECPDCDYKASFDTSG